MSNEIQKKVPKKRKPTIFGTYFNELNEAEFNDEYANDEIQEQNDNKPQTARAFCSNMETLWNWLTSLHKFERDAIKGEFLFTPLNSDKLIVMEDKHLEALVVKATFLGLRGVNKSIIKSLLMSDLVTEVNYIHAYFKGIKPRPTGAIAKLAACITTTNDIFFLKNFTKWLTACVANAHIQNGCQNHMCLVLTGGQGKGKTTFYQYLCPKVLTNYMFTGELDLKKKSEAAWKTAEYWLINLEEQIKALNREDANTMKALITLPDVKGRKPYGMLDTRGYRIGNFMASSNDKEFLNDPTGSRRYLSFEVLNINQKAYEKINIDDVWSEAYANFLDKSYTYWIAPEDVAELEENNRQFVDVSQEHELVDMFFKADVKDACTYAIPSTYIHGFLVNATGNKNLNHYKIGRALTSLKFARDNYKAPGAMYNTKCWFLGIKKNNAVLDSIQDYKIVRGFDKVEIVQTEIGF